MNRLQYIFVPSHKTLLLFLVPLFFFLVPAISANGANSTIAPTRIENAALSESAKQRKEEFVAHIKEQLHHLDGRIGELKEKGEVLSEQTQAKFKDQLHVLQVQKDGIKPKLEQARESSEAAWEDLKKEIDQMVKNLKKSLEESALKFF